MKNKNSKNCGKCKKEVIEKKVKTQEKGKDYFEAVEEKEMETYNNQHADE